MNKKILIGSILAVFFLMMTPCIPALQVQSNESSINKTLNKKASLLFTDADNAETFESINSLVFKRLSNRLIDDGFQGIFDILRKLINRGLGLCYIIMSIFYYPLMLLMISVDSIILVPGTILLAWLFGIPISEALQMLKEMFRSVLDPAMAVEMFKFGVYLLVHGEWPLP